MGALHIYTTNWQPAVRYRVPGMSGWFRTPPGALVWCRCCKHLRRAKNVELQVYYDMTNARCKTGKGCKR